MKRRITATVVLAATLLAAASACSKQGDAAAKVEDAATSSVWVRPPKIETAMREGDGVVVRGQAGPNARVVLRGTDGAAVAVAADATGGFELRVPVGPGDVRLTPEVQVGEDAAPSPETLVLVQPGAGPLFLVASGEPTRRLDGRGALDAVDSDGAAVILSGKTSGGAPNVLIDGARAVVMPGPDGVWRATAPGAGASVIEVDGVRFAFPGFGGQSDFTPVRAGDGWRLTWATGPSGRQTVWLPDRRS
ncbi:hypothetical protein [Brevundimonas sp. SL130]|uniref:hypothetical protein n=1 Tax=Brevundimonas sp. SL130 TaxID=2995143 RepID=UPI00226C824B|nr:hypothetical protein [Brevundimonas sp. SL130]WAC61066.1 hypothetical protein OU998_06410 [Brevundimonas sp. SL130]